MQEYIDIVDKNGKVKKSKVIFRLQDKETNNVYIVYDYENQYYAAKYDDTIGLVNLDTNLRQEEIVLLEELLNNSPEV